MLSTKPIITYTPVSISGYQPSVFVLIDSDKGPDELTEVTSLNQFYQLYGSINKSDSYNFAKKLARLGYRLLLKRVKLNDSRTSARLISSEDITQLVYPGYGIDYHQISVPQSEINNGIHAFTITIDLNKINSRVDQYGNIITDYIFIGDKAGWDLIWFDLESSPVPWYLSRKLIKLSTNGDVKTDLINALKYRLGLIVDDISTSNTVITLLVKSYNEMYYPVTSFSSKESLITDEDVRCYLTDDKKVLDIFSKSDNCIDDISVTISKWLNKYRIEIDLYNVEDEYVLKSEIFTVSLDESDLNYIDTISDLSEIVEVKYYGGQLPVGTLRLGRLHKKYAVKDDFIKALDDIIIYEQKIDFISDSFWYNTYIDSIRDSEVIEYINKLRKLRDSLQSSAVLLMTYRSDDVVNNSTTDIIIYFNGILIDSDNIKYPSSLYFLELLTHGTVEGYLSNYSVDDVIDRPKNESKDESGVNDFVVDSYNVVELLNPLAYFNYNYLITMNELTPLILTLNKFLSDLDELSVVTDTTTRSCFDESKYEIGVYTNSNIDLNLVNVTIIDRVMTLNFEYRADYSLQQQFELVIPIQGVL